MKMARIIGALFVVVLAGCDQGEPVTTGSEPAMRRLTEAQYRNIVRDVFGPTITFGGLFDPLQRTDGLTALGARTAIVTPAGFEQFYAAAKSIAVQVTDAKHRDTLIPCRPAALEAADDVCAGKFYAAAGRLLLRRPLTTGELDFAVAAARAAATESRDFYRGLAAGLAGLLVSPKFLFVADTTEADPAVPNAVRLTGEARAARLSFLLWDSAPDDALLMAAAAGELTTDEGLARQVRRMMRSAKVEHGLRAFFADFLDLQRFETLEKDQVIYPAFNVRAGEEAREQILRTVTDHVVARDLDYRDLFTTRRTFLTPRLAVIHRVPTTTPAGAWSAYEFPEGDARAGLATAIGFLAVNSHPGKSSPTLRGRAIRETLLCQKVPDPPGDVDFSVFNDPGSPLKTARERLTAHRTAETCAGCHKITDPIGLALENFDGAGAWRDAEHGAAIDPSGELDGVAFRDAAELGRALRDNPATSACLVNRLTAYALGRPLSNADREMAGYFEAEFAAAGHRVTRLLERIALSRAFMKVRAAS